MKTYTVDRIEEGIAVCEGDDLSHANIEISLLPEGTGEGSVVRCNDDGSYELLVETENERRKKLFEMLDSLFDE